MEGVALYLDSPDGESPAYNGRTLRAALRGLLYGGEQFTMNARTGLFPVSRANHVSMSSGQVYVPPICGVYGANAGAKPYIVYADEHYFDPPPADAMPRIDSVIMRVLDVSEDDNPEDAARFETAYLTGIASSTPTPPETPIGARQIATVSVPPSGSPTVTNTHLWTVAMGGVLPCRSEAELPTNRLIPGMMVYIIDSGRLLVWSGSSWNLLGNTPGADIAAQIANYGYQQVTAAVTQTGTSFGSLSGGPSVTVNVGPSGRIRADFGARYIFPDDSTEARAAQLRVSMSGANTGSFGADHAEGRNSPPGYTRTLAGFEFLTGLNPGVTTFTLQYQQSSPDGCTWDFRQLAIEPR